MRSRNKKAINSTASRQAGVVLVVALIIMLILTLVVVSSTQTVVLQERMTTAMRDSQVALEVAESGLKAGEAFLDGITGITIFSASGAGGLYAEDSGPASYFDSTSWTDAKTRSLTVSYDTNGDGTDSSFTVQYYIEVLGVMAEPSDAETGINLLGYGQTTGQGDTTGFRIVSRATGLSGAAERVVISYYGKRI
ncbi:hypothetical protein NBRC116494_08100 [Aurantivibrio plasticivorans]